MPSPDVDRKLAKLAGSAIATLATEMVNSPQAKDRIAAANSILDRVGFGRTTRAQADAADEEIRNALDEAAGTAVDAMHSADPLVLEEKQGQGEEQGEGQDEGQDE